MQGMVFKRAMGLALVAAGCVVASAPAPAAGLEQVIVEAKETVTVGRTPYGAPEQLVQISRAVSYGDLDLKTDAGKAELDKRLNETATALCKDLDKIYPLQDPKAHECVKKAVKAAKAQVDKAPAAK